MQIVAGIDTIDENDARLCMVIGGPHNLVPQIPRLNSPDHSAIEYQIPGPIGGNGLHKSITGQNRHVEIGQLTSHALSSDKFLNIRMIAPHRCHHGAPSISGAHNRATH
jgi:hypothetical protein